ncbi:FUSC family membrane protein [Chitinophagaceae bacterium LWZ2-11]
MDYLKEYRSFINSHYLSEGVRMSVGILLPALILGHYDNLAVGISVAFGALSVSITDNPGPIHHRRNGLIICNIIAFLVSLITGFAYLNSWTFLIIMPLFCFFFSMIGVYGTRAGSIGVAALFVMVLQTQHHYKGWDIVINSLYILAGGTWYLLLSIVLYTIRPFKLTQQALGEYVMASAEYLRGKAEFYKKDRVFDEVYRNLLSKQIIVQEKQNLVAELIFKTRSIVKESTHTGRVLMMIYLDVTDLFERAMTSHQDYEKLHDYFDDNTNILSDYYDLIMRLANELDKIGIALKSGRKSGYSKNLEKELLQEREHFQKLRMTIMNPSNIDGFISLRHILDSIDDIAARIKTLHHYTSYDSKLRRKKLQTVDPEDFISHQTLDPKLLLDSLSFRANIFRHSLRITLAAGCSYLIAQMLHVGHSYWILLTVVVILKPAYSLTKKRNYDRLIGTIFGAIIGVSFLYVVKDKTAIVIFLAISMIGAYSFMRKKYMISVMLMTVYLLFMFNLLDESNFREILKDRVIDTAVGSCMALIFSYLLTPVWEHEQINDFMSEALRDTIDYYKTVAHVFSGVAADKEEMRVARKNNWVSLANLSDAFTRMLSEPKSKRKNIKELHQFVVADHMLASHVATLSYYTDSLQQEYIMDDYKPVVEASLICLENALKIIEDNVVVKSSNAPENDQIRLLDHKINTLMRKREEELEQGQFETDTKKTLTEFKPIADQFYFIYKISTDLQKITIKLSEKESIADKLPS